MARIGTLVTSLRPSSSYLLSSPSDYNDGLSLSPPFNRQICIGRSSCTRLRACQPTHQRRRHRRLDIYIYIYMTRQWIRTGTIGIPEGRIPRGTRSCLHRPTHLLLQYRPDRPNVAPSSKFINIVTSCILQTIRLRFNPLEKMRDKWKNWNDKRNIVLFGMRWNLIPSYDLQSNCAA